MAFSILYWVNYTNERIKLCKKSEQSVAAGHVLHFTYDTECMVASSRVQASMRDKSYKVRVFLDDSYGIPLSSCECVLRESKCHHVAATLLFGYKNATKTDVKCAWLKRPKSMPKDVKTVEELYPLSKPNFRALNRPVDQDDRDFIFNQLHKLGRFTAMHWILAKEPVTNDIPPIKSLEELLMSKEYTCVSTEPKQKEEWLRANLKIKQDQIAMIQEATVGQRINPMWSVVRRHRLTASNFGIILEAVRKNKVTPSCKKRLLSFYNLQKKDAIVWGIAHEEDAIKWYQMQGAVVKETGIWLHPSGVLGASPDGIVLSPPSEENIHFNTPEASRLQPALIEVKCPFSAREMTILEATRKIKNFCLRERDDSCLYLPPDHHYYHQLQGQMYITQTNCVDLIVWTPKDVKIVRVGKDLDWAKNITTLTDFYFSKFLNFFNED